MTPEFVERVRRDYNKETTSLDWNAYLAGYIAGVKRFAESGQSRREMRSKLGYSRIGRNNI